MMAPQPSGHSEGSARPGRGGGRAGSKRDAGPASLVWFRQDLRLSDNPALRAAVDRAGPVAPVFLWSPEEEGDWAPGAASRVWLHHSLEALADRLQAAGSRLTLRAGPYAQTLIHLAKEVGADAVFWNRRYEPAAARVDREVAAALAAEGLRVEHFPGALLLEPEEIRTSSGGPYRVFTPYYRACLADLRPTDPVPAPRRIRAPRRWPRGEGLDALGLLPRVDWAAGIRRFWSIGESAAHRRMRAFARHAVAVYADRRDRMDSDATSRLSSHLHFGEISPRQVWRSLSQPVTRESGRGTGRRSTVGLDSAEAYLRQLIWREFAHHLLHHFPHTPERPLDERFARMPWSRGRKARAAWQCGETGYPVIDAAMRQLWETGWMHNRARMIVASFLVKDLLLPWQQGARWFWDTLVDADLANNTFGWQWTAGCGADAAPFFRIFNPMIQGRKFDPEGAYVRRYVPELARLDTRWIHAPWDAPDEVLRSVGLRLGKDYPAPIVDHFEARDRALEALERIKRS